MANKPKKLGMVLIEEGIITEAQLTRALDLQKRSKDKRLGEVILELSYATEEQVAKAISKQMNMPYVDLNTTKSDPKAASLLDSQYAKERCVLPLGFENGSLVVAVYDPLEYFTFEEIRSLTGYDLKTVISPKTVLRNAIEHAYSGTEAASAVKNLNDEYTDEVTDADLENMDERVEETALARMINSLINQAAETGASDIHFEPTKDALIIRFRINGDLVYHTTMKLSAHNAVVTRIKLLSEMNIAEKRVPQDGKIHYTGRGFELDIRVSSLPTIYGEKIVMRLLGNTLRPELLNLNGLGMDSITAEQFQSMIKAPNGIILVTGPTGSGKTTTLYAALSALSRKPINIVSIEDPVEQRLDGLNQVQVNEKAGMTFASVLRSILRQDPDIIMVGEMRDEETAQLGMRAAITGHLVFSTLHTNDTCTSIMRLIDMGVPPYMVAAALSGVIAQRLVKTLCPHCRKMLPVTEQEKLVLGSAAGDITETYHPVGCEFCSNTGYTGRKPIFECLKMDGKMRDMISSGKSAGELYAYGKSKGMRFLRDNVLDMVKSGETDLAEMQRVVYSVEEQ